jgi:hypothetical protein
MQALMTPSFKTPPLATFSLWSRDELMAYLSERVALWEELGASHRAAIRSVASELGLHPMRVRRLVDLYPEA